MPTTCLLLPLVVPTDSSVAAFPAYWAIQDPGRKVFPSTCKHGCLWPLSVWFSEEIGRIWFAEGAAPSYACPGGMQGRASLSSLSSTLYVVKQVSAWYFDLK